MKSGSSFTFLMFVFVVAAAGGITGCGKPMDCGKCGVGYACDTSSGLCVADPGFDASAPDMAMGKCLPACALNQYCNASNRCVPCLQDSHCSLGNYCKTISPGLTSCVAGCADNSRCSGKPGDGGASSQSCCAGQCADTSSDPANCGRCGMTCAPPNATAKCKDGACATGACHPNWGDCNKDPSDGCEVNLHVDKQNCMGCGMACPYANGVGACSAGCYLAACEYGFDDCDNNDLNGCETSTIADANNCGACGHRCPALPHSKLTCANAVCALQACDIGFSDCNHDSADGCEVSVNTDAKNCGACGAACAPGLICVGGGCTCQMCNIPNASATCTNNVCVFDKCNPGFADCNNNHADGCEVDLNYDNMNCGQCGVVCPAQTPSCGAAVCTTLYTFQGIQQNIPVVALAGWSQCFKDTYADQGTAIATILAGCPGGQLLLACRQTNSPTLTLAANAPRSDVIFDTAMGNTLHNANGVSWYFNDSYSWGFVKLGDAVSRNSCDTAQTNPDSRMCWHTGGKTINSGYRCGSNTLNGSAQWERLIYSAP